MFRWVIALVVGDYEKADIIRFSVDVGVWNMAFS